MKSTQNYKSATFSLHYSKSFCTLLVGKYFFSRGEWEWQIIMVSSQPTLKMTRSVPLPWPLWMLSQSPPCTLDPQLLALGDNETQHLRICDVHNPGNQWGLHWTLVFEDKREGGGKRAWGSVAERLKEETERREAERTPSGQRGCGLELGPPAGWPGTVTYYFYCHSLDFKYTLAFT